MTCLFRMKEAGRVLLSGFRSFSFFPDDIAVERHEFECLTTEEAWRRDWENIGGDFRRAYDRLACEIGA